jgi:hypothetical protein
MHEADSDKIAAALAIVHQAMARIEALSLSPGDAGISLRAVAERLYSDRRKRDEHFPPGLFGEPAWDLLLALFVAREDGRELSLAEACEAAGADAETGPEVIRKLESNDLVARGGSDGGTVRLTERAVERLSDYLARIL